PRRSEREIDRQINGKLTLTHPAPKPKQHTLEYIPRWIRAVSACLRTPDSQHENSESLALIDSIN
ncbi:hypothetical protein, partial [Bradyrhizobium sp. BR13661]|uniref:hypothetical protein n=1 Tax=Bradyrhizobium sp. BR13661 TaxID=2940622 RepID=UPI002474A948